MPVGPRDAADDVLTRARALLDLELVLPKSTDDVLALDLRRLALAMGMAALDTYLHWAVQRVPMNPLPKSLREIEIPFGALVDSGRASVSARSKGKKDRPETRARNLLHETILRVPFQSPASVEKALAMLGLKKCWSSIAPLMAGSPTPAEVKARLASLGHSRNQIVHEGDLRRLRRPRTVTHNDRRRTEVEDALDWLENFIHAIDALL